MLAGIPEAAWILGKGMLEATGIKGEPPTQEQRSRPQNSTPKSQRGAFSTGVLNSSHFPASPGALAGSSGWGWNSPSRVSALRAELGIIPSGIIP